MSLDYVLNICWWREEKKSSGCLFLEKIIIITITITITIIIIKRGKTFKF